jgi:hypothetical protein
LIIYQSYKQEPLPTSSWEHFTTALGSGKQVLLILITLLILLTLLTLRILLMMMMMVMMIMIIMMPYAHTGTGEPLLAGHREPAAGQERSQRPAKRAGTTGVKPFSKHYNTILTPF